MLTLLLSTRVFIPPPDCFVAADLSLGAGASPAVGLMLNWGAVNLDGCTESTVRLVPGITKKNILLHKHPAAKLHRCAQFLTFIARVFVSGRLRAVKGRVTEMSWCEFAPLLYFTSLESGHKMKVINARLIVLQQGCQT